MMIARWDWRGNVVLAGLACAVSLALASCGDPMTNSGVAHPGNPPASSPDSPGASSSDGGSAAELSRSAADAPPVDPANPEDAARDAARPRTFSVEGPDGAARVNFDDLDLLKLLQMDPVTPDCVDKLPVWLKGLNGRKIRIRGYMKPGNLLEGIPQFLLVRSTDLCCFGPKGKVYHMIAVTLKPPATTSYIELKPFDVAGTFRIEMVQLDDGMIFLLYHMDDATIILN